MQYITWNTGATMKEKQPFLSVVITCFNYELYIKQCIESVLEQKLINIEIIVVDDGSTDQSSQLIGEFKDRVTAFRTENRGALGSSLFGLSRATGKFVYFLDADDLLQPDALKTIIPHLRPDVSKIQFMLVPINQDGLQIGEPFPKLNAMDESGSLIRSIRKRGYYNTPPTSGNIYRRDVYDDLGDLSYERAIDGVPYLLAPFVGNVISIDEPLGKYRIHNSNLSSFSALTSDRMRGYADRFVGRLRHLSQLIEARGLDAELQVREDYAYVLEMRMLSAVALGQRPSWSLVYRYLQAVRREQPSLTRQLAFMSFALGLYSFPDWGRRQLAQIRLNPSRLWRVRSRLKNALPALK